MIIYIHGQDSYRSQQYLNQTIEQFKKKRDPQAYNVVILDDEQDHVKILGEIRTTPFLAEKRLIVINNILSGKDKDLLAQLVEIVKNDQVPETNIIVFYQSQALGKVKEVKELEVVLKKLKYAQEFKSLDHVKLLAWIRQEIGKNQAKISEPALSYLAQNAGADMWFLSSLIHQLSAYKQDQEIGLVDAQLFLDEKLDDNIFNMVGAIVSGHRKQAFKLLQEQRRLGEDEFKIFSLITWQFRILLEMRDLFDRKDNLSSDQIAKELGIHPFVAKKNIILVKRYPLFKLKQIHEQLLDIDYKTKTGQADQSVLIDLFVGRT
ncbi:MAG: DNA polymerase III subunit delta [bacterium]